MDQLLTPSHVLLGLDASTREEALRTVAKAAEDDGVTDSADALYQAIMDREAQADTGLMDGYAIPHAKTDAANRVAMFYARTTRPLEWPTMDDSKVTNLFVLISPASNQDNAHLKMLSNLASCLLEDDFKQKVPTINDVDALVSYVSEYMRKESEES